MAKDQTHTYILVFRAPALELVGSGLVADIKVSPTTLMLFTTGPIEFGTMRISTPPVSVIGDQHQDIIRASPATVSFPEGHSYIGITVRIPSEHEADLLGKEIGMAISAASILLGSSHFLECLYEGWAAFASHGKAVFPIHFAHATQFDPQEFTDSYRDLNTSIANINDESLDRIRLMMKWFSKAIRELGNTEDKFVYYWTVLEVLVKGKSPMVALLLQFLSEIVLPEYDRKQIDDCLQIGRLYGTRCNLYHQGKLDWISEDRGIKFKLLHELCTESLRFKLGLPLSDSLKSYFNE